MKHNHLVNENITASKVMIVLEDGSHIDMALEDALEKAYSQDMDLVCVAPNAPVPVCKIIDYNKFLYEIKKKDKEIQKHNKRHSLKEVKFSLNIASHDIGYKLKHIKEFLEDGKQVKVTLTLKGRELSHTDTGIEFLEKIASQLAEVAQYEKAPVVEGRNIRMLLSHKKAS